MNVCLIQARLTSTRLPGKCIKKIDNKMMTTYVIEAAERSKIDQIALVVPLHDINVFKESYKYKGNKINIYGGSRDNVLNRYYESMIKIEECTGKKVKNIVRLTSDCPLLKYFPNLINDVIKIHEDFEFDYTNNVDSTTPFPSGLDVEVISRSMIEFLEKNLNSDDPDREHVSISLRKDRFRCNKGVYEANMKIKGKLSIDTAEEMKEVTKYIKMFELRERYG
jgi:spore coat polysaccharide biosynthesis protein SpsF